MELLDQNGLNEQEFLQAYSPKDYPRPSVAADIVIFTIREEERESYRRLPGQKLHLLLIRRAGHPYLGCWALPGGFVRPDESAMQAARRELREETGVAHAYLEQLALFSDPGRDPRMWVMSSAHMALVDSGGIVLTAGDDAAEAAWFQVDCREDPALPGQSLRLTLTGPAGTALTAIISRAAGTFGVEWELLENNGLAFDHAKIIAYALCRLREQVKTSGILLNLMPALFPLTRLQQVYEAVLGKDLLKAAFRRKIAPLVEETEYYSENAGHRPSRLYRRKQTEPEQAW